MSENGVFKSFSTNTGTFGTKEFLESIIESDHFIFDEGENGYLIEEAKEILANRK